jgi:hypothetical protein
MKCGRKGPMKLSAKFARQEDEETRLARVTRRRVTRDRAAVIRKMLGLTKTRPEQVRRQQSGATDGELLCPECQRRFRLAMHLGRHVSATHHRTIRDAAGSRDTEEPVGKSMTNGAES